MTNNTPDYAENLAFEPEMTWEDLVEWAKEFADKNKLRMKAKVRGIDVGELSIWPSGIVYSITGTCLNINRTPRQMQTIIKALYE